MAGWSFQVCPSCGKHGRPITPDGQFGQEMVSVEFAQTWVDQMYRMVDQVSIEDMAFMLSQINSSNLARTEALVDPEVLKLVDSWNHLINIQGFTGDPAEMHEAVALHSD